MIKQAIMSPQCLQCASWNTQNNLFCAECFLHIVAPRMLKNHSYFEKNQHIFLIPWRLNDYNSIDQLVYRLKNLQSELALQFYLEKLFVLLQKLGLQNSENILVPIPSSRSQFNHAHSMAKRLSQMGFGKYFDILSKQKGEQQKHLSRSLRAKNEFFVKPEYEDFTRKFRLENNRAHQVLFIDDILTTGESFKRCSELLDVSDKALCVTLFYREKAQ